MYKIWNWLKGDFRSVSEACYYATKGKIPKWMITIYYVVMFPIGLLLWPILKIWAVVYVWKLQHEWNKIIRAMEES